MHAKRKSMINTEENWNQIFVEVPLRPGKKEKFPRDPTFLNQIKKNVSTKSYLIVFIYDEDRRLLTDREILFCHLFIY